VSHQARRNDALEAPVLPGDALVPVDRPNGVGDHSAHGRRGKNSRFSTSERDALKAIAKAGIVSVDLETKGLHPHASEDAAIGAMILKAGEKRFLLRELPAWWPEVLADESTKKIGHNLKFDLMWMIEFCPGDEGLPIVRNVQDTMLKSQLYHRYRTKSGAAKAGFPDKWEPNDLKSVLFELLSVEISKEIDHDVTDWTGKWSPDMIDYMLEDIDYLEPVDSTLDSELQSQGQERASWIEQETVFATAWMQLNGIQPDVAAWQHAISHEERQLPDGTWEAGGWIERQRHLLKHLAKDWPGVTNFNSPAQLVATSAAVLGGKLPNTKKATLKQLAGHFPVVDILLDQRQLATYLKNWGPHYLRDYVCSLCGRFHPGWSQIGTETSRPSCSRPNLCQIPRSPEFRRLFVASPGNSLASLDYSAIEVLTAGVFANEKRLIQACASGDPHLETARMVSGNPEMTKKSHPQERQDAKIANFGLLFGGGRDGLIRQARDLFDVYLSEREAERLIATYFKLYPGLRRTRNMAYDAMKQEGPIEVTNGVGFRRVLEGFNRKPTSWLNTWIQSTAQYGMKSSFRYLREACLLPFIVGQVYDELLFEFPDDFVEEGVARAKACMIQGMRDVLGQTIPVHVDDTAVGKVWL
jgi:DNA polymerase I-like protein with 3'-5' exonuclease and polymerase domains